MKTAHQASDWAMGLRNVATVLLDGWKCFFFLKSSPSHQDDLGYTTSFKSPGYGDVRCRCQADRNRRRSIKNFCVNRISEWSAMWTNWYPKQFPRVSVFQWFSRCKPCNGDDISICRTQRLELDQESVASFVSSKAGNEVRSSTKIGHRCGFDVDSMYVLDVWWCFGCLEAEQNSKTLAASWVPVMPVMPVKLAWCGLLTARFRRPVWWKWFAWRQGCRYLVPRQWLVISPIDFKGFFWMVRYGSRYGKIFGSHPKFP